MDMSRSVTTTATDGMPKLITQWCLGCGELAPGRYRKCPYCGSSSLVSAKYHIKMLEKYNKAYKAQLSRIQTIVGD